MSTHHCDYDYAVVGGGPVGAVMALGLAGQGHRVALIEQQVPQPAEAVAGLRGVDPRTVALSVASKELLDAHGAWPISAIGAFAKMEVWEERGTSVLRFGAQDVGQSTLGHIAEVRPWLVQLWDQLGDSAVDCLVGQPVTAVGCEPGGYRLTLGGDSQSSSTGASALDLFARTLIAADGAGSVVRRALGVPMQLADTGQSALAFAARVEHVHEHTAFQRFLADGPLALLPMADEHLVSVVWSARNARADELSLLPVADLAAALTRASEARLGRVEQCLPAVRFPLRQGVISSFCPRPNLVFIGDAARVVHPLAGQGVNLGFEDVRALLGCTGAVRPGQRPNASSLQRFARVRRARSRLAVTAMSALSSGYSVQSPSLLLVRNLLTRALGRVDMVRRALVLEAMGLGPIASSS